MDIKIRSGKKRARRTVTDWNHLESVVGMADICALNFPDELGKVAGAAAGALRAFIEALDKHESDPPPTYAEPREAKPEKKA